MNDHMIEMYRDMTGSIIHSYDEDFMMYLFWDINYTAMSFETFLEHMFFEYCKYAYDETSPKYPLRHFIPYSADDNTERMMYSRVLAYIQKYRTQNYNVLVNKDIPEDNPTLQKLKGKDMSSIDARKAGYEISEMGFFEATTIHDLQIIKAISENRIYSSKKVSNTTFIEYFEEYDNWVKYLIERSKKSDEDMVFATIAFFTLEWKYSLEYYFAIAEYMLENDVDKIDFYTAWMFTGTFDFDSSMGITVGTDSRMVKDRIELIPDYYDKNLSPVEIDYLRCKYIETLTIKYLTILMPCFDGGKYIDWFKNNVSISDIASFFRDYDVFQIWKPKSFTNEKIRKLRYVLEETSIFKRAKMENPDFRA